MMYSSLFAPDALDAPVPAEARALRWHAMTEHDLDAVLAIESQSYSHPWTRGNFADALKAGFHIQLLSYGDALLGYFVAMRGVDEAHLLNITVSPAMRGRGFARLLLDALALRARQWGARQIWLEVRASHTATQRIYQRNGYETVATRKAYYPLDGYSREDALVMKRPLESAAAAEDAET